jgi:anti-sigma-K factor RskA
VDVSALSGLDEHDELGELAALYALGALTGPERHAFEAHLGSCTTCLAELRSFTTVVDRLAFAAPVVSPRPAVREHTLASLRPRDRALPTLHDKRTLNRGARWAWLAAAAMLVISVGLTVYSASLRERIRLLERQVADALRSTEAARVRLAVLTAPDLTDVALAGQAPAQRASGRALWSRSRGVVFAASSLPALPPGRTYQLWYLTSGAPVSAGVFEPEPDGRAIAFFPTPELTAAPSGFAVSLEPEGGVPAPTGAIYLAGH